MSKNLKKFFVVLGILALLILAWHIRTSNVENLKDITTGEYTLGPDLDPFLFLRYSKYIVENGSLMVHDNMRNVPLGFDTAEETKLLPYMIAYFHKILNIFSSISVEYSAIIFPSFMFLLTVIAFFLFIKKVFEDNKYKNIIALIASTFLIVAPSLISRTVAGIPEKESAGFFFMFLAFYFFLSSWKSKSKKNFITAVLAGLSTALMGLIWGGWIYIFTVIALFVLFTFFFGLVSKRRFICYSIWITLSFLIPVLFSTRYNLSTMLTSTSSGIAFMVFSFLLLHFVVFRTKLKNTNTIKKLRTKLPDKAISSIFMVIIGVVFLSILFGISFIPDFIRHIIFQLRQPYWDRLAFTVAENRQPYFDEWKNNFGPILKGIPVIFWLFFISSIFLFYEAIKKLSKKTKWILASAYILFLFTLIFSRQSPNSIMNGTNTISGMVYFGGFILIIATFAFLLFKQQNKEFQKINSSYLFLLVFFFISLIGARSAVRLIMVLAPPVVGIIGYFSVLVIEKAKENQDKNLKIIFIILAIVVSISLIYSFYNNYQNTLGGVRSMVPSSYTHQWQKAMSWVRQNTSEDAVFSHWWDYGYWIQSIGNRATVLDGGNAISYWNHLLGRHVLTGQTEKEALEFLYTHNSTHLLIDSTEIGKYTAYSSIGGDENYDRYSQISTFMMTEKDIQETKNSTLYLYRGSMFVDQDYVWYDENGNQLFFPSYKSGILGVILEISNDGEIKQPKAVFIYQGTQTNIPMKCIYYKNKTYEFEKGYGGCLYIIPEIIIQGNQIGIDDMSTALFITEKSMNALWIKLYLFNQEENFKLVHNEPNLFIQDLKNQGLEIEDIVLFRGIQGPIKIWEINYPEGIEFKSEYLETKYPASLQKAKNVF